MDKEITAEEVIKALEDIGRKGFLGTNFNAIETAALIERLAKENARLREAQRWISVEEDKPESGVHVLLCCEIRPSGGQYVCDGYYAAPKTITCEDSGDCACEYDDDKDEYFLLEGWCEVIKNWNDFSSIYIEDFVTHWRALPDPPRKG